MTDTSCHTRVRTVSFGNMRSAPAVHCLRVVGMRRRIARAVSIANERPELEPVIARNFSPTLPGLVRCNNIVKALA